MNVPPLQGGELAGHLSASSGRRAAAYASASRRSERGTRAHIRLQPVGGFGEVDRVPWATGLHLCEARCSSTRSTSPTVSRSPANSSANSSCAHRRVASRPFHRAPRRGSRAPRCASCVGEIAAPSASSSESTRRLRGNDVSVDSARMRWARSPCTSPQWSLISREHRDRLVARSTLSSARPRQIAMLARRTSIIPSAQRPPVSPAST